MDFPRFVYISPGMTKCQGGSFDGELVQNPVEHEAAIKAGFSDTVPEALAGANDAKTLARAEEIKASPQPDKRGPGRPRSEG
jgi:hypothetical protein